MLRLVKEVRSELLLVWLADGERCWIGFIASDDME